VLCPKCDQGYYQCNDCGQRVCGCPHNCSGYHASRTAQQATTRPQLTVSPCASAVVGLPESGFRLSIDGAARPVLGYR
jgi:hypothetical protein